MVRHRIVKEWLPTFVRWLHQIHEYKRSLGDVFSLAIAFGWLRVVSVNWSEEAVRAIMTDTNNIDPAAAATFMERYEAFFDKRYSYVDKVCITYLRDPTELQNILLDKTGLTLGQGPRPSSYL
ncbi:hypothetical protein Tco_1086530, partial [Tanacetum coccineum]